MKRGKPLSRRKSLTADPRKAQEFIDRGRRALWLSTGLRSKPKRGPVEGPLTPAQWRAQAFKASGGVCIVSGARARNAEDRRFDAHHILPKEELRKRGHHRYVWDPRNAAWVGKRVHRRHTSAVERIPRRCLPRQVWQFCAELDVLEGTQWATSLVLRAYPAALSGDLTRGGSDGEGSGDGR